MKKRLKSESFKAKIHMKALYTMLIIFSFGFFTSCSVKKRMSPYNYHIVCPLPGCEKISDGLYCDIFEISITEWREYLYWVNKVYGDSSKEYRAACPDFDIWDSIGNCKNQPSSDWKDGKILVYPAYFGLPITGISQDQVFCLHCMEVRPGLRKHFGFDGNY